MAADTFRIHRSLGNHEAGAIVSRSDLPPHADINWLIEREVISPCTAAGIPLMASGAEPTVEALLDEVEKLTETLEEERESSDAIKKRAEGLEAELKKLQADTKAAAEHNGNLIAEIRKASSEELGKATAELTQQVAELRIERDKLNNELIQAKGERDAALARIAQLEADAATTAEADKKTGKKAK